MLVQSAKSNPNPTLHRSVLSVEHPRGEPLAYPLNDYVATITSYKEGKRQRDELITTAACQYYHERRSCHSHILTLSVSFVVTNISSAQYKQSVTNVYLEDTDLLILYHAYCVQGDMLLKPKEPPSALGCVRAYIMILFATGLVPT